MNLVYTNSLTKDVRKIKDDSTKKLLLEVIHQIKSCDTVREISSVKKIRGYPNAYRIKIKNYRLGLYLDDETVILARFLKREDIYKIFPK